MWRKVILFSLLVWPLCAAQPIAGPWRTFSGDQPHFAAPAFNDQSWTPITAPPIYPPRGQITWYRIRTQSPAYSLNHLVVPSIFGAYEVFVNGKQVGAQGIFGQPFRMPFPRVSTFAVPPSGADSVIAVRVEVSRVSLSTLGRYQLAQPEPWLWVTAAEGMELKSEARFRAAMLALSSQLPIGALFALLLMALQLWRRTRQPEILYFVVAITAVSSILLIDSLTLLGFFEVKVSLFSQRLFSGIYLPSMGLFLATFIRVPLPAYLRLSHLLIAVIFTYSTYSMTMSPVWSILRNFCVAGQGLLCIAFLVQNRQSAFSRRMLRHLAPIGLVMVWLAVSGMLGLSWTSVVTLGYVDIDLFLVVLLALVIGFSSDFAKRVSDSQLAESRLLDELTTAARIQTDSLDVPDGQAAGWRWRINYSPAQEVGGDFYQVMEVPAGGLLVLLGDVSGKGLAAALTVSEVLGAFRALCAVESRPGHILAALNALLRQRKHAGFVTACCLHLQNQQVTIANAGHLAPYLDGEEFAPPSGLPLGILPDTVYPEHTASAQHVLLLTDGIPEARNATGELFGFPRTVAALPAGAASLVETARTWGQDDDMTVVELRYAG